MTYRSTALYGEYIHNSACEDVHIRREACWDSYQCVDSCMYVCTCMYVPHTEKGLLMCVVRHQLGRQSRLLGLWYALLYPYSSLGGTCVFMHADNIFFSIYVPCGVLEIHLVIRCVVTHTCICYELPLLLAFSIIYSW